MTEIMVRRATPGDVDAMLPIWREMMELHQRVEPARWTMVRNAETLYRDLLATCLEDPERLIAVAVRDGHVVGFVHAGKGRRPPVVEDNVFGSLDTLCVTPAARRQGIGRALVAEAMKWFQAQGLTNAEVGYALANPLSGPFWTAMGFRPFMVRALRKVDQQSETEE